MEEARQEAARIVGDAKATAERVRADSERELTAASQRRDSINAQLANVRQMLATLTGTAAMPLSAFGADDDEGTDEGGTDEGADPAAAGQNADDEVSDEADAAGSDAEGETDDDREESLAESRG